MANEKRLIDANALLDDVDVSLHDNPHTDGIVRATHKHEHNHFMVMIMQAPTVDAVEVVHVRWEEAHEIKSFRHTNIPVVQCSECECYFCDIINNHHYMYHYCPNCGAKMDGDGNG